MIRGTYVRDNSAVSVMINTKAEEKRPAMVIEQGEVNMDNLTIEDERNYYNSLVEEVRQSGNRFMAMVQNIMAKDYSRVIGGAK